MADPESVVEPTEPVEPVVAPVEPAPEPVTEPHPLEPGGERFEQVYARMKQAEVEKQQLAERVARLEGQAQVQQRVTPSAPIFYTPDQLQALVDQGRITPMQAADVIATQRQVQGAQLVTQQMAVQTKMQGALEEVNKYIGKMPVLRNTASAEFQRVAAAAYEVSEDMGLPVQDPRVQRRALRETFGTLDKMARVADDHEAGRRAGIPHTESAGDGSPSPGGKKGSDPLAGVPKRYLDFWKSKGYSPQLQAEYAALLTEKQRQAG